MILLFDTNTDRATKTAALHPQILCWRDSAWRDAKGDGMAPDPTDAWFLVHNNDWDAFIKRLTAMGSAFLQRPAIRFTGGDPSGKPDKERWVRYRPISEEEPFTKEELEAMDRWAKGGCKSSESPWICTEDKPLHLIGLLILLKMARHILDGHEFLRLRQDSQKWNVSAPAWWRARLDKEQDWPEHLREEWGHRKTSSSQLLEDFINWVTEGETSEKDDLYLQSNLDKLSKELSNAI